MKTLIFGYGITGKAVETFFKVKSKEYLIYDDNENVILDIKKELLFDDSQIDLIDEIVISPGINPSHKQIKNFETNIDKLDLRKIDADLSRKGNQKFKFSDDKPQANSVWFKNGRLSADINGNQKADFEIRLVGSGSIHQSDIFL